MFKKRKVVAISPRPAPAPRAGTVEYMRTDSFEEAERLAGAGYSNDAVLSDLQSSWFYIGEPRLTDTPDFFAAFFAVLGLAASRFPHRQLRVLDFGGATGRYSAYASAFFHGVTFNWHVVETEMYAQRGRIMTPDATFSTSLNEIAEGIDVAIFSGVLQYLKDWKSVLDHPVTRSASLVFITRTPVGKEAAFLQSAHYSTGSMLLPSRVIPKDELESLLSRSHRLHASWLFEHHLGELGVVSAPSAIWSR